MNQYVTRTIIKELRERNKMTQLQLADKLGVTDKTISKWECGKGLPEVSLMLPLCAALDITVNDLLSGEKVSSTDYQKKAEGNMMNLMKENEENKKRMALSIITGAITVIAVYALIIIAAFIDLPTIVRIILIMFSVAVGIAGIAATAMLDIKAGYFECPYCKELFVPSMDEYIKSYHTFTKRRLTCPKCGKTGMCKHLVIR